jgi:hypothetical protein
MAAAAVRRGAKPHRLGAIGLQRDVQNLLIGAGCENFPQGLTLDLREPWLVSGWDDQKVVNFEQILFANGRILKLIEAPAQRVRAFHLTFWPEPYPGVRRVERKKIRGS